MIDKEAQLSEIERLASAFTKPTDKYVLRDKVSFHRCVVPGEFQRDGLYYEMRRDNKLFRQTLEMWMLHHGHRCRACALKTSEVLRKRGNNGTKTAQGKGGG